VTAKSNDQTHSFDQMTSVIMENTNNPVWNETLSISLAVSACLVMLIRMPLDLLGWIAMTVTMSSRNFSMNGSTEP